jgi:diacylglycerol O-acyltransferase
MTFCLTCFLLAKRLLSAVRPDTVAPSRASRPIPEDYPMAIEKDRDALSRRRGIERSLPLRLRSRDSLLRTRYPPESEPMASNDDSSSDRRAERDTRERRVPDPPAFTRLSALDASFLSSESERTPMVLGLLVVYDAKPLLLADGSLDVGRIRRHVAAAIPRAPCLRRRIAYSPLFRYPVWVDAEELDLEAHITRAALPSPGDSELLLELAERLYCRPLPRDRPLWEIRVIEGLRDDRFALLIRMHHAMVDGGSGLELIQALHGLQPEDLAPVVEAWRPRPAPSAESLFVEEVAHRFRSAQELAGDVFQRVVHPLDALQRGVELAGGLLESAVGLVDSTPLDGKTGSRRRVRTFTTRVAELKRIRARWGGTLNDVVLAVAAGALRTVLQSDPGWVEGTKLRVACPLNRRRPGDAEHAGNYTATFLVDLPVDVPDRLDRYCEVVEATRRAKKSGQAEAIEFVLDVADRAAPELVGSILALSSRFQNLVISNFPGPQAPIYLLGCRAQEIYPLTILLEHETLALTAFSYDGTLSWVLCADRDAVPSLDPLEQAMRRELESFRSLLAASRRGAAGAD